MKRIRSLLLAMTMIVSLSSCGTTGGADPAMKNAANDAEKAVVVEDGTNTDTKAESAEADTKKETAATGRPQPIIVEKYDSASVSESDYTQLAFYRTSDMVLSEESAKQFPELAKTLQKVWEEDLTTVEQWLKDSKGYAREQMEANSDYYSPYSSEQETWLGRCDDRVLCVVQSGYSYEGGAHGYYGTAGYSYDVKTGKKLEFEDIVTDKAAFEPIIKEKLSAVYPELIEEMESFDAWGTIKEMFSIKGKNKPTWSLDDDGVIFYFNPYELASYAAGQQIVEVSFAEYPELFVEEYLPNKEMAYITRYPAGDGTLVMHDINGDGALESITVHAEYNYENEAYNDVIVEVDGNMRRLADLSEMFDLDMDLITMPSGKVFVAVGGTTYNDYRIRTICDISDGTVQECRTNGFSEATVIMDEEKGIYGEYVPVDPAALLLGRHFDLLSTYDAQNTYVLGEDGQLKAQQEYYMIPNGGTYYTLTSVKEITADIVDEDGKVTEKDVTIPKGSTFKLYRTDGKEEGETAVVDARLSDGRLVRFHVTNDYPHIVNGTDENELFETLYYAG